MSTILELSGLNYHSEDLQDGGEGEACKAQAQSEGARREDNEFLEEQGGIMRGYLDDRKWT